MWESMENNVERVTGIRALAACVRPQLLLRPRRVMALFQLQNALSFPASAI